MRLVAACAMAVVLMDCGELRRECRTDGDCPPSQRCGPDGFCLASICDDGNACTVGDAYVDDECVGAQRSCLPIPGCFEEEGSCNVNTGACEYVSEKGFCVNVVDNVGPNGGSPDIAIGSDGLPVLCYRDGGGELYVMRGGDAACSDGNTTSLPLDQAADHCSIAIGSDGFPVVSYSRDGLLSVAYCHDPGCTDYSLATPDPTARVATRTSIGISGEGLALVAYYDAAGDELRVARCDGPDCNWTTADNQGSVGKRADLAVGHDGLAVLAYYDDDIEQIRLGRCSDAACLDLDPEAPFPAMPEEHFALAIPPDGMPFVAYAGEPGNDAPLLQIRCADPACGVQEPVAIGFGRFVSLAVGWDGHPIAALSASFHAAPPEYDRVAVLHCGAPDCLTSTTMNVWTWVDGDDIVMISPTSIAIGAEGLPIIAYHSSTQPGELKVAKCATMSCAP